ncbi:MAG TPA: FecR domain-containing protein [Opitutaceae bacterium]|nr:FecR domain-containing protein [Opitutaceae bacterium]HRJ48070.1 FecR domain-containing protein [Opitutaceae bacterium]
MKPTSSDSVFDTAANWLARNDAGLNPAEQAELRAWLEADPAHAAAWAEVQTPWDRLDRVRSAGLAEAMIDGLAARQRRRRRFRRQWGWGLAAAAVVTIGLAVMHFSGPIEAPQLAASETDRPAAPPGEFVLRDPVPPPAGPAAIVIHRPAQRLLADGSVVEYDDQTLIEVAYSEGRREIRLTQGVAHFTVQPDATRPFVVHVGPVEVRAVGTAFVVDRADHAAEVLVTEGRVEVIHQAASATPRPLPIPVRGRVVMPYAAVEDVPPVEILSEETMAQRLQWRAPRLQLRAAPLGEIVAVLGELNDQRFIIEDQTLAALTLSGRFRADNIEGFVRMLESNYGVTAERTATDVVLLRRP